MNQRKEVWIILGLVILIIVLFASGIVHWSGNSFSLDTYQVDNGNNFFLMPLMNLYEFYYVVPILAIALIIIWFVTEQKSGRKRKR